MVRASQTKTGVTGTLPAQSEEFRILVAEDSVIYRKLMEQCLSKQGHPVLFAKDGREALDLFASHRPAIVITDWTMPDVSGLDLVRQIRQNFREAFSYIILITSNTNKEQVIEGLSAGADDYVTKPFHEGELLARVGVGSRMVELHRQLDAKNRQLEELALTDPLTGLPNRRAVEQWTARQFSAAARHRFPVWVAIADLDHFKKVNDTYGHEAGDLVLEKFSELLKAHTRKSNMCARLGGEEFLLIITHVDKEGVKIAVERLRSALAEYPFEFRGRVVRVTASFGITGLQGTSAPDLDELLKRADAALYSAKNSGRNRLEFAGLDAGHADKG